MTRHEHKGFLPPAAAEAAAASRRERLGVALRALGDRRRAILATAVAVVAAALLWSLVQEDRYEGVAKLLIAQPGTFVGGPEPVDPERLARTHIELIELESLAERVRRSVRVPRRSFTAGELVDKLEVDVENDSDVLSLRVRDRDPVVAATLANEFAEQYVEFRRRITRESLRGAIALARRQLAELTEAERAGRRGQRLERQLGDLELSEAQLGANVDFVKRAGVPQDRVSPRPLLTALLAIPAGLLLGLLVAGLASLLDRRLKREEQVEALTGLPVVAAIPHRGESLVRRKGSGVWADPAEAEAYGRLATNLRFFEFDRSLRTLLVTSAVPQEGKTTVTLRLAAALAAAGQGVLAIEADMRRPTFAEHFSIQFPQGLSSVLIGATTVDDVATRVHTSYALSAPADEEDESWTVAPYIEVVPAGVVPPNPGDLLASNALTQALAEARDRADVVLLDSPPLVPVGDAIPLAGAVDGILLVVQVGLSRRDEVRKALKLLGTLRSRVVGIVVTSAERPDARYDAYVRHREPPKPPDPLGPRRAGTVGRRRRPAVMPLEDVPPELDLDANGTGDEGQDTEESDAVRPG